MSLLAGEVILADPPELVFNILYFWILFSEQNILLNGLIAEAQQCAHRHDLSGEAELSFYYKF